MIINFKNFTNYQTLTAEFRQMFSELLNLSFNLKIENIIEKVEKMQLIKEIKEFLNQLKEKSKL